MKIIIISLSLLLNTVCAAQINYTKHASLLLNAHRAKEVNDNSKALSLYEEAFSLHTENTIAEYLNAANCAAQLNNINSCKKWIIESISRKKAEKKSILEFSKNEIYQNCANEILINYNKYLSLYYTSLKNPMAFFKVQKLINRDQNIRKIDEYYLGISEEDIEKAYEGFLKSQAPKDSIARKKYQAILFPKVSEELKELKLHLMRYTDSLNIISLIDITTEYGWQKEAWLILWHQRGSYGKKNYVWNFFKPFIDNEIKQGKLRPSFWAEFEDFKSLNKTGKSVYGYSPGKVDVRQVNKNRQSIGLPDLTLEEIEARNNSPYGGRKF